MKRKFFAIVLAMMLVALCSISLTACGESICKHEFADGECTKCDAFAPSEGLEYKLSRDGTYYSVIGIGECDDTYVVIPAEHNDLPVTIIESEAFKGNTDITGLEIHDGVEQVNPYAFKDCVNIETVKFSKKLKKIGWSSFEGCASIKVLNLPNSVESIDFGAFRACSKIEEVTLGKNIKSIGSYAFAYCVRLMEITIPAKTKMFGERVFIGCYKLVEVCNKSSLGITAGSEDFGMVAYYAKNVCKSSSKSKITKTDDGFVFYSDKNSNLLLGKVGEMKALPEDFNGETYSIYDYAFYYNLDIVNLTVPKGVTAIGNYAYANCSKIVNIDIGEGVTIIGNNAFYSAKSARRLRIGSTKLNKIGLNAFREDINLTEVTFIGLASDWQAIEKGEGWSFDSGIVMITCNDNQIYA